MLARIVTSTDINFLDAPYLGLASLMLEAGYDQAEEFVDQFRYFIQSKSVYLFLRVYAYITPPSVSICLYLFARLLGDSDKDKWLRLLTSVAPSHTSNFNEVYNLAQSATVDNYKLVLDWFDYPFLEVAAIINDPFVVLSWCQNITPGLNYLNNHFKTGDLTSFLGEVVKLKTGVDITKNIEYHSMFRRWVNLSFSKYAYGSDINQIRWY